MYLKGVVRLVRGFRYLRGVEVFVGLKGLEGIEVELVFRELCGKVVYYRFLRSSYGCFFLKKFRLGNIGGKNSRGY